MSYIFLYVTAKDSTEAKSIAKNLLEQKIIACANFFPITSMYQDNGIQQTTETVMILKTKAELHSKVEQKIKEIHSYDTPCIIRIDVEPNQKYTEWLDKIISP